MFVSIMGNVSIFVCLDSMQWSIKHFDKSYSLGVVGQEVNSDFLPGEIKGLQFQSNSLLWILGHSFVCDWIGRYAVCSDIVKKIGGGGESG